MDIVLFNHIRAMQERNSNAYDIFEAHLLSSQSKVSMHINLMSNNSFGTLISKWRYSNNRAIIRRQIFVHLS